MSDPGLNRLDPLGRPVDEATQHGPSHPDAFTVPGGMLTVEQIARGTGLPK
ncbi:hypothetical protein ACFVAV_16990 [Nocardia sp. NPDC057663]|uniref:hypothetical protein n=1 Tax=Nocardia sp. NPDC057663 TaxID=3346201 RepID=UPI00367068F9